MSESGLPQSVVPHSYDNSLGAILIGGFVSIFLYGVTCLQVFIYYQRYPRDKRSIKSFVYLLWTIDSFDAALTVQICYHYMVSNYANPLAIFSPVWSLKLHVLVTSVSNFIVRNLFARRIYTLSHGNKFITGGIVGLSIVDLVVGTIITARAFRIPTFAGLTAVTHLFFVNFASNIAADIGVAVVLSYYLWTNRIGSQRTSSLVGKLILYTVNTGVITFADAALGLICYAVSPNTLIFIAFYLNLSKFYVNSYLASLNVRKSLLSSIKGGTGDDALVSMRLSQHGQGSPGISQDMPAFRQMTATGLSVSVPETEGHLSSGTGTMSAMSKGDGSTAVNTPIDGDGSILSSKGEITVDGAGADNYRRPPGILVDGDTDRHGELDPEGCYEDPSKEYEVLETRKQKDLESGSEPSSPIDP